MNLRCRLEAPDQAACWTLLARACCFSPEVMARAAGLSVVQLRRRCRERFGETFGEWCRRERMVAARQLLAETESVKLTLNRLGYEHRSQMSRDFWRAYETTPTEWLRWFRGRWG